MGNITNIEQYKQSKEKTVRELYEKIKKDLWLGTYFYDGTNNLPLNTPWEILEYFIIPETMRRGLIIETPAPPDGCPKAIRISMGECPEECPARN